LPVECTRPPDEGGNRRSSEVIRGHQSLPVECTRPPDEGGNRRSSEVIRGHQSLPVECTRPPLRAVVSASLRRCAHAHYAPACERRECHAPWPCASPLRSSSVASILSSPWKHAPDEGVNQLSSEVIRGHQRSSEVIRWSSAWKHAPDEGGNQLSSEVIRGHQRSSEGHQPGSTLLMRESIIYLILVLGTQG
jgi:hypothetical protein